MSLARVLAATVLVTACAARAAAATDTAATDAAATDAAATDAGAADDAPDGGARDAGPPSHAAPAPPPPTARPPAPPAPPFPPPPSPLRFDSTVRGATLRHRTASEYNITIGTLAAVPRDDGAELLDLAPGVILTNDGNEGHASHIYMRGFFGEDGSDTAQSIEGVPLNDHSNPEHHGYTDVYMVIPELVDRLDVTEGTPDPRQGDFAVAGSIDYRLALHDRGLTLKTSYGMYDTARVAAFFGPAHTNDETFAGIDYAHSDGYGSSRSYDRASLMSQWAQELRGGMRLKVLLGLTTSRWDSPGVIREDDYAAGRIGFYGAYPTTLGQGGSSSHGLLAVMLDRNVAHEHDTLSVWARVRDYTLRENFTGYYDHPVAGDLTRFLYRGATAGATGSLRRGILVRGLLQEIEAGFSGRYDRYDLSATQMDATTGLPIDPPDPGNVAGNIGVTDLALWLDLAIRPWSRLTLRGGVRVDVIDYQVDSGPSHLDALATHAGPKATAELYLGRGLTLVASYGSGFRSADAMTITQGAAPVATVSDEDVGLRFSHDGAARVTAALSAFHSQVSHDELFDPSQNRDVAIGATHRLGGALWVRAQPLSWLDVNGSFVYTYAVADENALEGAVRAGSPLPYLPPLVARIDVAVEREIARWRRFPVVLRGGIGGTLRGPIPLITISQSAPTFIVDLMTGVRFGFVEFDLGIRNLFDTRWRESEYENPSSFVPGSVPSPTPVQNFTAGRPFMLSGTLTLKL